MDLGLGLSTPTGQGGSSSPPGTSGGPTDKKDDTKPSDGTSTSAPPTNTTPPAGGGETATQPSTGTPATTPPGETPATTPPGTGAPTSPGQQCDIARGGVDCGTNTKSPSTASGDTGGPQRNYGGGTTPSAGAAAGSTGTTGTAGNSAELADTGQGANLTLIVVGGATMAAGGFAFTVLPGRLNRRGAGAHAAA